jgi:threonine/homoserine efflux transporter RhtA
MSRRLTRVLQCTVFILATATYAGTALSARGDSAQDIAIVAGALALITGPYSLVRDAITRSDDTYALIALLGGAATVLGFLVLDDSVSARTLSAVGVLLLAPSLVGPRRNAGTVLGDREERGGRL